VKAACSWGRLERKALDWAPCVASRAACVAEKSSRRESEGRRPWRVRKYAAVPCPSDSAI
jgi:hypothetical protein